MGFDIELRNSIKFVNESLEKFIKLPMPAKLDEAMRYSLFPGGKRLRSVILVEVCKVLGGKEDDAAPFACALEMIHTYSLIHDDLPAMDDDDERRGMPTNHKVFGEGVAILAGDALLNRAYEIMADFCVESCQPHFLLALQMIGRHAGASGMVGGQAVDIQLAGKPTTDEELEYIYTNKTAKLFMAAFGAGAHCAGVDAAIVKIFESIGLRLGFAFQALDDIEDKDPNAGRIAPPDMKEDLAFIRSYEGGGFLADLIERIVT